VPSSYFYTYTHVVTATHASNVVLLQSTGGQTITFLDDSSGATIYIDSDSADDAAEGTGLQTGLIFGISENNRAQVATFTMNGTDAVEIDGTWRHVSHVVGLTFGSGGVAAGEVTIQNATPDEYYCAIDAGDRVGFSGYLVIPQNAIGELKIEGWATIATTATDNIRMLVEQFADDKQTLAMDIAGKYQDPNAAGDTPHLEGSMYLFGQTPNAVDLYYRPGALKIGTTNQAINYRLTWGWLY
jgi:hypothetical protein